MINLINKQDYNKSGIYIIENKINGKYYIGSTYNFKIRFKNHNIKFNNNKHTPYFQNSYNKYGGENFTFDILDIIENINDLCIIETMYITLFDATNKKLGYNFRKIADSPLGTVQNKEWVEKRKRFGEEHHCTGNKHSEEYKKDLSEKMKIIKADLKDKPRDSDITERMTATKVAKYGKKVEQFNRITGESIQIFDSIGQAEKNTKVTFGTITTHCNLKVKRYTTDISWRWYIEKE